MGTIGATLESTAMGDDLLFAPPMDGRQTTVR
jgi:hypothetical protein